MNMNADIDRMNAGFHALAALRVYDRAFSERTPYKIVAAVIGGHAVDEEDIEWLDGKISTLEGILSDLPMEKGDMLGALSALKSVRMCLNEEVNPQLVYNMARKAESAVSGL